MFNTLLHFSWKRGTILREIYKYAKYNNHNSGRSRGWKPITRTKNQRETFAIGFSVPTITVWSGSNALWRVGRLRFACHILVPLDDDDDDDCERMISLTMSRRRISLFSFFEAESCGEVRSIKWRIYFFALDEDIKRFISWREKPSAFRASLIADGRDCSGTWAVIDRWLRGRSASILIFF